jgi:predicted AAA+ superfamily ATPase
MRRKALKDLVKWKEDKRRKPMVLFGIRQVGKTWLMQEFGREYYKSTAYLNFDHNSRVQRIFAQDLDSKRIVHDLGIEAGFTIDPEHTLIIFDEVQECPSALTALKYFCENAMQYHIIAAGSLLGVAQREGTGFPVGKVDMLTLFPLSFREFLSAMDENRFIELIQNKDFSGISVFRDKFIERLKQYFYIGGMPEAVLTYRDTADLSRVRKVQETILHAYYGDFSKHIPPNEIAKVRLVWESLPDQLGKENKRFLYSSMKEGSKGRDYEVALQWLKNSGLIHQLKRVSLPNLPLAGYQENKIFKLYMPDIGLLSARTGLELKSYIDTDDKVFHHYKGALTEQFVLQDIRASYPQLPIFYWANDKNTAEMDFVIQFDNTIIPIEVKSGGNVYGKSLKTYMNSFSPSIAIRSSLRDYSQNKALHDIPLYMVSEFADVIESSRG